MVSSEGHSPFSEVLHWCLAEGLLECSGEGRSGETAEGSQCGHRPWAGGLSMDGAQRRVEARVRGGAIPAWPLLALAERSSYGLDQDDVEEPVEDGLLTGCRGRKFARE